jgi:uncharacterized membrane protein
LENLTSAYLAISTAGIGLAIYTAYEYLNQNFSTCSINPQVSCGGVFQSGHTSIFGIPFYVLGLVWFPFLLAMGLVTTRLGKIPLKAEFLLPVLMVGNIFTAYLWYLEIVVIGIVCPLCVCLYAINYSLTIIILLSFL